MQRSRVYKYTSCYFLQFDALDGIGFKGFAVCYHKEYAQVIGTSGTVESFTPAVHEYFHALVTVGKYIGIDVKYTMTIMFYYCSSSSTTTSPSFDIPAFNHH